MWDIGAKARRIKATRKTKTLVGVIILKWILER
jgi:hypothetical protein